MLLAPALEGFELPTARCYEGKVNKGAVEHKRTRH